MKHHCIKRWESRKLALGKSHNIILYCNSPRFTFFFFLTERDLHILINRCLYQNVISCFSGILFGGWFFFFFLRDWRMGLFRQYYVYLNLDIILKYFIPCVHYFVFIFYQLSFSMTLLKKYPPN